MKLQLRKLQTNREEKKRVAFVLSNSPDGLLAPLNRVPHSKRVRRVIELVRALQTIDHEEAVLNEVERQLSGNPNCETAVPVRAPSYMYARANEILSTYHWKPIVLPPPHAPNSFSWKARTAHSYWENNFVSWVLNQRASGDISMIRSCRTCQRWFYAITNHQAYCIDSCRQQFHSRDLRFKEKRRLYMRRYRNNEEKREFARDLMAKKDRLHF
jgi:hypothetical protein